MSVISIVTRILFLLLLSFSICNLPHLFAQSNPNPITAAIDSELQFRSPHTLQTSAAISQHVVYRLIYDLDQQITPPKIWIMKMSADGIRLVFATAPTNEIPHPQIYTIRTDGTGLTRLFDYATLPDRSHHRMYLDMNADGTKVIWTDGVGEIFIASSGGGDTRRIATAIPRNDGHTEGPNLLVWPRITADGQKVYFIHTGSNPDVAGGYRVFADGSGQTQLFSYRQLSADVFGMDGNEFATEWAFQRGMAISDDGSRMVFGTRNFSGDADLIAFDGRLKKIFHEVAESEIPFALSHDGSQVMLVTSNSSQDSVLTLRFSGGIEYVSHCFKNHDYNPIFSEMSRDNTYNLFHSAYRKPCLISPSGYGRNDLFRTGVLLSGEENALYRAAIGYTTSLSADGQRFCFKTEPYAQPEKIWIAEINGPLADSDPTVQQAEFIPNWLLKNGSARAAIKVWTNYKQASIRTLHLSSYRDGEWVSIIENILRDNGSEGDALANDGIFTHGWISAYDPFPDPVIPLTLTACLVAENLQTVSTFDLETFYILSDPPSGAAPRIISIEPASAIIDAIITINGENFALESYNNIVLIGNRRAAVVQANVDRNKLKVVVPHQISNGPVGVTVSVAALTSNTYYLSIKTGIDKKNSHPLEAGLVQNFPNPFNPGTEIFWQQPLTQPVNLSVYDLNGRLITTLVTGQIEAGPHRIHWDGRDNQGLVVPSGIYFYRLQTEKYTRSGKAILLR